MNYGLPCVAVIAPKKVNINTTYTQLSTSSTVPIMPRMRPATTSPRALGVAKALIQLLQRIIAHNPCDRSQKRDTNDAQDAQHQYQCCVRASASIGHNHTSCGSIDSATQRKFLLSFSDVEMPLSVRGA